MPDEPFLLVEHRECTTWGAEPTACPSGRIPWARIMAELEDEMKPYFAWDTGRARLYFVGPGGAGWCASQAVADELARVYGLPVPAVATHAFSTEALRALGSG